MPGYDETGPLGYGPRTGRGFGPCGRGFGFKRGFRRFGFRELYPRTLTKEELKEELAEEKKALQEKIKEIEALEKQD